MFAGRSGDAPRKRDLFWNALIGNAVVSADARAQLAERTRTATERGIGTLSSFARGESRLPESEIRQEQSPSNASFLSRLSQREVQPSQKAEISASQMESKQETPDCEVKGRVFQNLDAPSIVSNYPERLEDWQRIHRQRLYYQERGWERVQGWDGCDDASSDSYLARSSSVSSGSPEIAPIVKDSVKQKTPEQMISIPCLASVDYPYHQEVALRIGEMINSIKEMEATEFENLDNIKMLAIMLNSLKKLREEKGGNDDELKEKIQRVESSIAELNQKIQAGPAIKNQKMQEAYDALTALCGKTFERDFEHAKALIIQAHEAEGRKVPPSEITWEAFKIMDKALTGGDGGIEKSIARQRFDFHKDIFRTTYVIDGYLLSNIEAEGFRNIVDPNGRERRFYNRTEQGYAFPEDPISYRYPDVLAHAKQSDPEFQNPDLSESDGTSHGIWAGKQLDRYFDQQGVSLVERHRIYSEGHQGTLGCLTTEEYSKEHLERARDISLPLEERFAEYCRASFRLGRNCVGAPHPEKWDAAFVTYYDKHPNDVVIENGLKSKIHFIDLRNKFTHCHYLISYPDPISKERKIHHYHIQYDYIRDKKTVTEMQGYEQFPHPEEIDALPRFPIAEFAKD